MKNVMRFLAVTFADTTFLEMDDATQSCRKSRRKFSSRSREKITSQKKESELQKIKSTCNIVTVTRYLETRPRPLA
jgi:hypothetical protein